MPILYRTLLALHVAGGALGMVAFWVPVFARKGAWLHRRAGWAFAGAVAVVAASAVILSVWTLADPLGTRPPSLADIDLDAYRSGRMLTGALLGYLGLLTFSFGWIGIRSVEFRTAHERLRGPGTLALLCTLIAASIAVLVTGLFMHAALLAAMSVIGLLAGPRALRYVLARNPGRSEWLAQHLGAMLGAGIAFHTAFLVFGLRQVVPALHPGPLLWIAPTLIGGAGIAYATRRFVPRG
jgi:hypothetical protein